MSKKPLRLLSVKGHTILKLMESAFATLQEAHKIIMENGESKNLRHGSRFNKSLLLPLSEHIEDLKYQRVS